MDSTSSSIESSLVVTDFDGTLFDTRMAVKEAYSRAGIDYLPEYFGLHWSDWMPSLIPDLEECARVHARKNQSYRKMVMAKPKSVPVLPALHAIMQSVWVNYEILTSASGPAVSTVYQAHNVPIPNKITSSATIRDKVDTLEKLGGGIYLDDQRAVAHLGGLRLKNWTIIDVTMKTTEDILKEMRYAWTQSSWQQAKVADSLE